MLTRLSIRDIVLIERLDLAFSSGLTVLTGETGAGKSILLDSLGLALGARADTGLVRAGAAQGSVTAVFEPEDGSDLDALLAENGLDTGEGLLILRRVVTADRKSRAFVNDQPVSVGLLRTLGERLVEIHGQHDDTALLQPAGHRDLLDAFGGHAAEVAEAAEAARRLADARAALDAARRAIAEAARDADYLRHVLAELEDLAPEEGEEEGLANARADMMAAEKVAGDLDAALALLSGSGERTSAGIEQMMAAALRRLEAAAQRVPGRLDEAMQGLDRALVEAGEALAALDRARADLAFDPAVLERTEERLFALRAAARKHDVAVDVLPALRDRFAARLADLDRGEARVGELEAARDAAAAAYDAAASALTAARTRAARALEAEVMGELGPLALGKARFAVSVTTDPDAGPAPHGRDRVEFLVATIPGAEPGPLMKIASGGEISRFVLALKVALGRARSAPTLVFDEVDRGIGGATADMVGARLKRLADGAQVLVITHSPQVAARGNRHLRIAKTLTDTGASTDVAALDIDARREEIARMLAGTTVTDAARAAADSLLGDRP